MSSDGLWLQVLVAHLACGRYIADVGLGTGPSTLIPLVERSWSEGESGAGLRKLTSNLPLLVIYDSISAAVVTVIYGYMLTRCVWF